MRALLLTVFLVASSANQCPQHDCQSGCYCKSGSCTPCSVPGPGYFCPGGADAVRCPPNQHSCAGPSCRCIENNPCGNGQLGCPGFATCYTCSPGEEVNSDQGGCHKCPYPLYNPNAAGRCVLCPANSYWMSTTHCSPCPPGTYGGGGNFSSCVPFFPQRFTANVVLSGLTSSIPDSTVSHDRRGAFRGKVAVLPSTNPSSIPNITGVLVSRETFKSVYNETLNVTETIFLSGTQSSPRVAFGTFFQNTIAAATECWNSSVVDVWGAMNSSAVQINASDPRYVVDFDCNGSSQFVLDWNGVVLCLLDTSTLTLVADEWILEFTNLTQLSNATSEGIPPPVLEDGSVLDVVGCPVLNFSQAFTLSDSEIDDQVVEIHEIAKGNFKFSRCLFLHGVGNSAAGQPAPTFSSYWGNVEKFVEIFCAATYFLRFNTVSLGWDDVSNQRKFCSEAMAHPVDKKIRNTLIFSHSMGSLIIAGAIQRQLCDIDASSSRWYSVQSPALGSGTVDQISRACSLMNTVSTFRLLPQWAEMAIDAAASIFDFSVCTKVNGAWGLSQAYVTLSPTYKGSSGQNFTNVVPILRSRVSGSMCGSLHTGSPFGMVLIAQLIASPSDGVVEYSVCTTPFPSAPWQRDSNSRWFEFEGNHVAGTCRQGDTIKSKFKPDPNSKRPCSWFEKMASIGV